MPINGWEGSYSDSFGDLNLPALSSTLQWAGTLDDAGAGRGGEAEEEGREEEQEEEREQREEGLVGSPRASAALQLNDPRSWLQVGFGLIEKPSRESARAEFGQLVSTSMVEACRKCQVASVTQRFAERHKFGEAALAHVLNDRTSDWVAQAILSRPYIVDPIIESYVTVWGELLEQSLQQACVRICKGETVRSLLATDAAQPAVAA